MIKSKKNKFISEIKDLIKSLLNFCKYEIKILNNEISIYIKSEDLVKTLLFFKDNPTFNLVTLIDLTAVDYPSDEKRFMLVYNLLSVSKNFRLKVKVRISGDTPVNSVSDIFPCANWYEREVWDLFGISFINHPDLRRILVDYNFKGHPLRKDFPLTGFNEVRYSEREKKVVYEPVKLEQNYRDFDFESPWEGTKYIKKERTKEKSNE